MASGLCKTVDDAQRVRPACVRHVKFYKREIQDPPHTLHHCADIYMDTQESRFLETLGFDLFFSGPAILALAWD